MLRVVPGLAVAITGVLLVPAAAQARPEPAPPIAHPAVAPGMLAAMQRDLKLTAADARELLVRQDAAGRQAQRLRTELGARFGGAWFDIASKTLMVGTTDPAQAAHIRSTGAAPRIVARPHQQLEQIKARLDRATAPAGVTGWYVDVRHNRTVVDVRSGAEAAARDFVVAAGADPAAVHLAVTNEEPVEDAGTVVGGDRAMLSKTTWCSIGFAVTRGFVTAGHCGKVGTKTYGADKSLQGVFQGSFHPIADMGWVETEADWTTSSRVRTSTGTARVSRAGVVAPGVGVCRSGGTTGWHCGSVEALDVTNKYNDGTKVYGLTLTSVCADGGDSGGPFIAGTVALGVHHGRKNKITCSSDPTGHKSMFQPLQPILDQFDLDLVVSPGSITGLTCKADKDDNYACTVTHNPGSVTIGWTASGTDVTKYANKTTLRGKCTSMYQQTTVEVVDSGEGRDWTSQIFACK